MRVVVTAGGTSEPIDDVRVVTNLSSGRLGAALANTVAERDVEVVLLAGRALASHPEWIDPRIRVVPFGSFSDLAAKLTEVLGAGAEAVFMAAAVSDYTPVRAPGKLSSAPDEISVRMVRNPKLLTTLRDAVPDARLVGFKLLSGVAEQTLLDAAARQIERDRLDWCAANDLRELGGERHPLWLVPRNGPPVRIDGQREEVARAIVERVLGTEERPPAESGLAGAFGWIARSGFHPWLATQIPHAVLRVRGALAIPEARITERWASGSRGEARALVAALAHARLDPTGFAVDLPDGAQGIGFSSPSSAAAQWSALQVHLPGAREPVLAAGAPVGAVGDEGLWIAPALRRRGLGTRAADRLNALGRTLERGADTAWFQERGWKVDGDRLLPPSRRSEWLPAASVCLFDPVRREVLLGERRRGSAAGRWAFPGGRREPAETGLAAGLRELREETGITLDDPLVLAEHQVPAGDHLVHCSVVAVFHRPIPADTAEMAARWVPWGDTHTLPLTSGTRRVLESLR